MVCREQRRNQRQKTCKMINDSGVDGFHPSISLDPKISDTFTSPKLKDENILSKPFQDFVYLFPHSEQDCNP